VLSLLPTLLFAFLAGVLTILAPCTLPVIPVVLGGAAGAGRRRVLGIFVGFATTFLVLTVVVASVMAALDVTSDALRMLAAIVVGAMGAVLAVPLLARLVERYVPGATGILEAPGDRSDAQPDGLWRGVVIGGAIGLIWAPCVGPLMAAVIVTAVTQGPTVDGLLVATAYVIGASVPLAAIAIFGRNALRGISPSNAERLRRGFGVAMIVVALGVLTRLDVRMQAELTAAVPDMQVLVGGAQPDPTAEPPPLEDLGPAPELAGITDWINSPPTTLAALRGKVVLVHFWTFGCINCKHVQPYVKAWYDTYEDDGFVVLSVHTPELSFERDIDNVRRAVADADVRYPVAVDEDYRTWRAWHNRVWPAFYFVDKQGHIRYKKGGEGGYATSEAVIRALLAEPA